VPVLSVFGRVGNVVAVLGDYSASLVTNDSAVVGATVKDALNTLQTEIASIPAAPVVSVFGRVGAVVAAAGDYAAFYPPLGRTLTAGAGLTGGGDLSIDRTFDVGANADGSITVNANDVQVGVLATDVQHGVRGGGTQHAVAVASGAAGFLSGADKAKLDGITPGAAVTSVFTRTGAVVAAAGDYAASQVTNDSGVTGATVKAALDALNGTVPYYGTYGARPAAGHAGKIAYLTDAPVGEWVDDGAAWRPVINGLLGKEPGLIATFTWFNQGGATSADQNGATRITGPNDGASPGQLRGMTVANSAASAFARATFRFTTPLTAGVGVLSVLLRESGTGKVYLAQLVQDGANNLTSLAIAVWTSSTARSVFTAKGYASLDGTAPIALRVRRSGANVVAEVSRDGNTWIQLDSRVTTTVFTTAPDQAGWAATGIGAAPTGDMLSFESGS